MATDIFYILIDFSLVKITLFIKENTKPGSFTDLTGN